jgi:hypothetical protein
MTLEPIREAGAERDEAAAMPEDPVRHRIAALCRIRGVSTSAEN